HPRSRHGAKDATSDPEIISEWFDEHPDSNYGVRTDLLPTVDIDPRNGGDKAWLKLVKENWLPHTWEVATGGGGTHLIFGTAATPVPCGKLARGVDVKGVGGYIVGGGVPWWLSADDSGLAQVEQADRHAHDPWQESIAKYLEDKKRTSIAEILERVID